MVIEQSFGSLAKNRRRELGLTQDELARRVGCAPITIRKIEADDLRPSVQIAERMAMALNIPLEERAAFVKLARTDRMPVEDPKVTPMPAFDEIGSEDLSGRAIRGYALGERLGNGGMGVVYRAVQPLVEREVAIKIILPQYANHPDFIRRFEAEAQLVARLEHPHIVPLYDYWREPSVAYLIMRLLRGGSVQSLLRNGTVLTPETVLRMMEQIGSALSSAHRAGVVHRDLKPANVLLDEDNNAYLADFGIAKNLSSPSSDTQADVVIGSPDYISPEQIKSEFVRPQTDIYALGVMLYELLTGKVPFHGPTPFEVMHQHLSTPLPSLAANRSGLPKALDAVIEHATEKDPLQRYETVDTMLDDLRRALGLNLREIKSNAVTSPPTATQLAMDNPYKGLRAFGEGDAQDFFGRETLTQQLLVRLGEGGELARFLAVVGPSGSGKSSVVKAGLIPALRRGALPGSENWFIVEMLPGAHPLEELEAALLRVAVNPPASLIEQFQKDSRGLIRAVRRSLPNDPNIELVLVIDQFEEVFTLLQDENERLHFLGLLISAILDEYSRIRLVLTLRADFIDRPLSYIDFGELLHQRMELVLPLTPDELESAIVAPAERVGLHFEAGLVSAILHDLGDQPGTLPLLQYALTELYEKRAGNTLTKSVYHEIGGVLGALGRRAEDVFNDLDAESQTIARQIFLRLVTLGEGVEDTRRRTLITELENLRVNQNTDPKNFLRSVQKVLDAFGYARLLSFDRDPDTRGPTIEVAHEAIIREWTRLCEWLNESRADVRLQRQLASAANEWQNAEQESSYLLAGAKLGQFEGWAGNSSIALTQAERAFLDASISEREKRTTEELTRQRRELEAERQSAIRLRSRNRVITAVASIAVILALLAGLFGVQSNQQRAIALKAQSDAEANFRQAEAQRLAAEANRLLLGGGNAELIALLSLRSINTQYTSQGDGALVAASRLDYPEQIIVGTGEAYCLAISPDGKYLVIGRADSSLRLYDVKTGKEIRQFVGHTDSVLNVMYSADGQHIATASFDKTVRIWDVATGQEVRQFTSQDESLTGVAFSPDGRYVLGGTPVRIWDVATGQEVSQIGSTSVAVLSVAFSHDGKSILTGNEDGIVQKWDVQTGQEVHRFTGHKGAVLLVRFSSDDRLVLTASGDETARLWDAGTGKELQTLTHTDVVYGVAFSPVSEQVFTGSSDGTTRLWDITTGQELQRFTHPGPVYDLAVSPDGKSIWTVCDDGIVRLWSIEPVAELPVFQTGRIVNGVAFSSDGKFILTGDSEGIARLWNASTGQLLREFIGHTDSINYGVAFSPNGKKIVTSSLDNTVRIWNIETGQELYRFMGHTDDVNSAVFSPDGKYILTAGQDGARIWDSETGQEVRQLIKVDGLINRLVRAVYSPDGKYIATARVSADGTELWDANTGSRIHHFTGTPGISSVAFSPDGRYLLSADLDGTAWLWEIRTGKMVRKFSGHSDVIASANFSPDGKYIATAGYDGTVRLWNTQTGQELRRFSVQTPVENVVFSPDGNLILTGSDDGTARLWDVDYHATMDYLCSHLRDFTDAERAQYGVTDTAPACPQNQNSPSTP